MGRLSQPIDCLLDDKAAGAEILQADTVIVGSGYGGSVAALRLAGHPAGNGSEASVVVLERGREYALGEFPYNIADAPSHMRLVRGSDGGGYADALFNIHPGEQTDVLVGSGLGGTSLINASVAEEPPAHVFQKPGWPKEFRAAQAPLAQGFEQVRRLLAVTQHSAETLPKYRALERIGEAIDSLAEPATIAVSLEEGPNPVGVRQNACTDCGNCVTGCNVGAKNTLDRNLIPLAKSRGAKFYTGVSVLTVEAAPAGDYRWKILVQPTRLPVGSEQAETYWIIAQTVILAAGTLGSTEILLRSVEQGRLAVSDKLGQRFSTNGDGLIMSFAQSDAVNGIARAEQKNPAPADRIGPTITGIIRKAVTNNANSGGQITIEDASIPAALATVYSELVTTSALLQRLTDRKLPPFFKRTGLDPLVAARQTAQHCQTLLVMGDDGASGSLNLHWGEGGRSYLNIDFPEVRKNYSLVTANRLIKDLDRKPGLDHGQYAPNPLWQLLPDEASTVLSGELPEGRALTVHPLGGCAMGDSAIDGVVNHLGNVFDPGTGETSTHEGLYVFDGAIVPTALETNPFLTIAALAWRNCEAILQAAGRTESQQCQVADAYNDVGEVPTGPGAKDQTIKASITEQLTGKFAGLTPKLDRVLTEYGRQRVQEIDGLVVTVAADIADAQSWMENPAAQPLSAKMKLYVNLLSAADVRRYRPVGVSTNHHGQDTDFLELDGRFTIFAEQSYTGWSDFWGGIRAVCAYRKRRGFSGLKFPAQGSLLRRLREAVRQGLIFFNVGILQSRHRKLLYRFEHPQSGIVAEGEKVLGYDLDLDRMWPALFQLDLVFTEPNGASTNASLQVNAEYLLKPGLIRVQSSPDLPSSLMFAAGFGGFFARTLFTTSFWEFGGPEYPDKPVIQKTLPQTVMIDGETVAPEFTELEVPLREHAAESASLLLSRYRQPDASAPPILLLHGLAQGSQIFWMDTLEENLVSFFYRQGYDVWTLDYRLSNHVIPGLADYDWTMDEIARFDIPAAINHVYAATGQQVALLTHCVGSVTVGMAVLAGHVDHRKISSLIANAIHPWVITSPNNRFRARFAGFLREWVDDELLRPIPGPEDGALQNVLDRFAFGTAKLREREGDDHREFGGDALAHAVCDRMSFLYGRMWNHKNLNQATHDNFLNMLGPAPARVYAHFYHYSLLRRISDSKGNNVYLTRENIVNNWSFSTLFVHGDDSRVFNPHSARRSAIYLNRHLRERPDATKESGVALIDDDKRISYRIFRDYGHMDVIFGKDAHRECYPEYLKFLQDPCSFPDPIDELELDTAYLERPATGPLLRAAWLDTAGLPMARYWVEMKTHLTLTGTRLQVTLNSGSDPADQPVTVTRPCEDPADEYRIVDVALDRGQPSTSINFKAAHLNGPYHRGETLDLLQESWLLRLRQPGQQRQSFLVGSCRFPGSVLDREYSDKVHAAMCKHICGPTGAQLLFLVGDQIYADAADQLFPLESLDAKYTDRYRQAFQSEESPHFSALTRSVPTHFALDDHEISDNWSGLPAGADSRGSDFAINSACRYQGAARNQQPIGRFSYSSAFYYGLDYPGESDFPVFVMDTRTERVFRDQVMPERYELVSCDQFQALADWLRQAQADQPGSPKFIVSGSVVAPLPRHYMEQGASWRNLDEWAGYPATLERLLQLIVDEGIHGVVFVGGDAHLSATAELQLQAGGKTATVRQIVSSGIYAPMPFANARVGDYDWDVLQDYPLHVNAELSVKVRSRLLSDHHCQFVRVDATARDILVTCRDENDCELNHLTLEL